MPIFDYTKIKIPSKNPNQRGYLLVLLFTLVFVSLTYLISIDFKIKYLFILCNIPLIIIACVIYFIGTTYIKKIRHLYLMMFLLAILVKLGILTSSIQYLVLTSNFYGLLFIGLSLLILATLYRLSIRSVQKEVSNEFITNPGYYGLDFNKNVGEDDHFIHSPKNNNKPGSLYKYLYSISPIILVLIRVWLRESEFGVYLYPFMFYFLGVCLVSLFTKATLRYYFLWREICRYEKSNGVYILRIQK
jgi:hypothetical protein